VEASDLNPAITVLQLFLSSPKPSLRFAAMRTLSEVAVRQPISVSKCNDDMEGLVADSNRSIATLAITTLLKTGNESSIDRLMKQISSFMGEIGDEFKIVVVRAIRELCTKYPAKHRVMVGFLATFLREEGGYDFKKAIVDSIVELMGAIPETKETSLLHLCEFIEDCEFSELIVQILHLIGSLGPLTTSPSRYIRFIFNRVILENAVVRAAAVSTLGAFATKVAELRPSIVVLLRRSLTDEDDEVRDRAAVLLRSFDTCQEETELKFLLDEPMPMYVTKRRIPPPMMMPCQSFLRFQIYSYCSTSNSLIYCSTQSAL
jgi:coatomer subunit gamma